MVLTLKGERHLVARLAMPVALPAGSHARCPGVPAGTEGPRYNPRCPRRLKEPHRMREGGMNPKGGRQRPVLLVVDDDPAALGAISRELDVRYGRDYHVVGEDSVAGAERTLRTLGETGEEVALVLVDHRLAETSGTGLRPRRSCGRWPRGKRTPTCSSRGTPPTSSSTRPLRDSSTTGREPTPPVLRFESWASVGHRARMSYATCSSAARSRTRSSRWARRRGKRSSPRWARRRGKRSSPRSAGRQPTCRSWFYSTGRRSLPPPTPSSRPRWSGWTTAKTQRSRQPST